jgi:hypothetical protein
LGARRKQQREQDGKPAGGNPDAAPDMSKSVGPPPPQDGGGGDFLVDIDLAEQDGPGQKPDNAPVVDIESVASSLPVLLVAPLLPSKPAAPLPLLKYTAGQLVERELASGAWRRGVIKSALGDNTYVLTDSSQVHASLLRPARSSYNVGDWVQLRLPNEDSWVSTVINAVLDDDMYMVDVNEDSAVPSQWLRKHEYAIGDAVEIMLPSGVWIGAVVSRLDPICVVGRVRAFFGL